MPFTPSPAKFCDEHDLTYPLLRGLQKKIMCPRSHCSSPKQGNQGWQRRLPTPIVLTWSWACTGGGPFPHPPRTRFHTHHRRGTPPSPARRREASLHSMASQFLTLSGSNVDTVSPGPDSLLASGFHSSGLGRSCSVLLDQSNLLRHVVMRLVPFLYEE